MTVNAFFCALNAACYVLPHDTAWLKATNLGFAVLCGLLSITEAIGRAGEANRDNP